MERKISNENFTWHHFDDNGEETIKKLHKSFEFHHLDMEDVESGPQQPKADFYKDYMFAIFHFPYFAGEEKRIHVTELDVFLGKDYIITITKGSDSRIHEIFDRVSSDKEYKKDTMGQDAAFFLYRVIDELTENCWPVVRSMSNQINDIEEEIYSEEMRKETVRQIALIRRNLIRLKRIIVPQLFVITTLVQADKAYLKNSLTVYFDDVRDTLNRIKAITEGHFEVMDTLHNVNESLISQRTNEVIKVLTVISVSLLPMTLLTGVYGMNIQGLPFVDHANSVWLIFGVILLIISSILIYFRRRDWL